MESRAAPQAHTEDGISAEERDPDEKEEAAANDDRASDIDKVERWKMEKGETKRMFICCDGTWQNASGTTSPMTNVSKLARAVERLGNDNYMAIDESQLLDVQKAVQEDKLNELDPKLRIGLVRQIVYYSSGIGGQTALNIERGYSGLTGKGLESNILNAYCFICNNYNFACCRDEIILVGFSRGAFTVRCLANFIDKVGLIRRKGLPFLQTIFESWKRCGRADGKKQKELESEFQKRLEALKDLRYHEVEIKILAEWDSVSAIGLPLGLWREEFSFVNSKVPACVANAFFALALDEKRRSFKPRQWRSKANQKTLVNQCAFVGCHSDIGGGNSDVGLSTISLFWMISQISERSCAEFDHALLLQFMVPCRRGRFRLGGNRNAPVPSSKRLAWRAPEIELKNLAGTKGSVHESLTGWWRIPWALSLGMWHGKRDVFHSHENHDCGDPGCKDRDTGGHRGEVHKCELQLKVHFTVALLHLRSLCRLKKGYIHIEDRKRWVRRTDSKVALEEDTVQDSEWKLLEGWKQCAKEFHENWENGNPLVRDDNKVNWTQVARTLGWTEPSGSLEEGAVVDIIPDKNPRPKQVC